MNYAAGRDLELMAKGGVTISHCPINLARRGRYLETWAAYKKAGVNLALGSDTYPRDMIMNMRIASYVGKIMSGSYFAATAAEVFEAATLARRVRSGATISVAWRSGAKADIIIIDKAAEIRYATVRYGIR